MLALTIICIFLAPHLVWSSGTNTPRPYPQPLPDPQPNCPGGCWKARNVYPSAALSPRGQPMLKRTFLQLKEAADPKSNDAYA
ncbi:hypothetical protein PSTG_02885 [Puccinia striiformis f. sp. tritici PST-78]|uniref:Uncharacterized protein n=1 Tax=Puccinia striiformis f. sp. tritici PST-78 TaxID=1165861 RepID=A0A0L0VWU5_9BASI|nr:hypothetical protein PSTG_02885 [Puccinia striiformis f. sp. tritici PST-78]